MTLIIFIIFILLIVGVFEKFRHDARLRHIAIRIQVNGTRGKSTLVRMIVDLFTNAGWNVVGKISGETPQFFTKETGWIPRKRSVPARIKEQMQFVKRIYRSRPQAMVVENMALAPENQFTVEAFMMKSHLCVITNIRLDHQEIMGKTKDEIYRTISLSVPAKGKVIVGADKNTKLERIFPGTDLQHINDERSEHHSSSVYGSASPFDFNFAVLDTLRESYHIAEEAYRNTVRVWQERLQPKHFVFPLQKAGEPFYFADLFSCNDVESTKLMLEYLANAGIIAPPYIVVLTCREDRPLRTLSFIEWICAELDWSELIIAGIFPVFPVHRKLKTYQLPSQRVKINHEIDPELICSQFTNKSKHVIGVGNYVSTGENIISYIRGMVHDN